MSRTYGGRTSWYHPLGWVPPTPTSVGAKGPQDGPQGVKWLNRYNSAADRPIWLKFLQGDTYQGPRTTASVSVGTGIRIPPPEGVSSHFVVGAYLRRLSSYLQIWCVRRQWGPTTCGVVRVRPPRISKFVYGALVELVKSAVDCPISLKFCVVTNTKVPEQRQASTLEPEVEFRLQRVFFRICFWGISPPPIKLSSPSLVCA